MAKALVLFSGGQDSTVALAWALEKFGHVETIGFDYGQAHSVELDARQAVKALMLGIGKGAWQDRLKQDHVVTLGFNGATAREGVSSAFVPGRNLEFLLHASMLAYKRGLDVIVGGMCETDERGFPDCRADTLNAMQVAINLGMETKFRFEFPLMYRNKCASWWLASEIGGERFVELIIEETHTCYLGTRETRHHWGYGCGSCDACTLRAAGWREFCRELAS